MTTIPITVIDSDEDEAPIIAFLNLDQGYVVLADGLLLPITNLFDVEGEETEDPKKAHTFVAGDAGFWVGDCIENYDRPTVH